MRTELLKLIIKHGISVREYLEMKRRHYFAKTKQHNMIYLDGFIAKHKMI